MASKNANVKVSIDSTRGIERGIKKFKRLCESYGIQREYRQRKEHKKPSEKRKEKQIAAQKKRMKLERKMKQMADKRKI